MIARNLGRTLVLIAVIGVILCLGWWAIYYNQLIVGMGGKSALRNGMGCLVWSTEGCAQPQLAVKLLGWPLQPYTPLAMWVALAVLILGLLVVYMSASTQPYPVTPAGEPKLFVGKLEPFYAWTRDLSWLVIRATAGGALLVHGLNKVLNQDVAAFAKGLASRGLEPALPFANFIYFLESGGAVLIILGLFTRIVAPMIAIEFFIITFVANFPNGYGWTSQRGGWEFPLVWGLLFFAIALRGGGPYSVDRLIRREL